MTKEMQNLKNGDVIRVEYGDYDNWVTVVVDKVTVENYQSFGCQIKFHYPNDEKIQTMYGSAKEVVKIVELAN